VNTAPAVPPIPPRTEPKAAPVVKSVAVVGSPTPAARAPGFLSRNRTVLLFALFLLLTDYGVGLLAPVWERHSPDGYTTRVNGCAGRPRDVVFVGASPVAEGIDPALFAGVPWRGGPLADAYALGLSGGTTTDFYFAVAKACPTPPRVLVYGITASDLNDSRGEPHGVHSLLTRDDVGDVIRTRPDAAGWVARQFAWSRLNRASNVYRYRHGVRMWAAVQADAVFPGSCPEAFDEADEQRAHAADLARGAGYAPLRGYSRVRYDLMKAAGQPSNPFGYLDRYRTGSHLKYLHRLIDWCRARGVELVLVDMPVTADLESKYPAAWAEYRERLAEVERDRGLRVIRAARSETGLTDEHFADLIHLRPEGCRRFSLWLRERLIEAALSGGHAGTAALRVVP
jgi:hypothetical protein